MKNYSAYPKKKKKRDKGCHGRNKNNNKKLKS